MAFYLEHPSIFYLHTIMMEMTGDIKADLYKIGIQNLDPLVLHWQTINQTYLQTQTIWQAFSSYLLQHAYPFAVHLYFFNLLFPGWQNKPELAAVWTPTVEQVALANITQIMAQVNTSEVSTFHQWTISQADRFWELMLQKLNIVFKHKPKQICDLNNGITQPQWFQGGLLNISDSCFTADPQQLAVIEGSPGSQLRTYTYQELNLAANSVALSLIAFGCKKGDTVAIIMPMHFQSVAIYLGIIKIGAIVVSIADSFSATEVALRCRIAKVKVAFTQDNLSYEAKVLALYAKLVNEPLPEWDVIRFIVLPHREKLTMILRKQDSSWNTFLTKSKDYVSAPVGPMAACNILFSSGTTGEPKAIIWNHSTPIKAASDAYLHLNIKSKDRFTWPTNLGWMMGPWLIFATLINKGTLALFTGSAKGRAFGEFIAEAKVNLLGVVPTLVAQWRHSQCMENLDWQAIKVLSSTGECSNPEDMFYLMYLAGYKPMIEYCGGTEIGGAYITSTVIQTNYPSLFSTPAMGLAFKMIDEMGQEADEGEVAIVPPALGLSTQLINADHEKIYYANMPTTKTGVPLRRHGDRLRKHTNGYYTVLGRTDDAMNLGGIKISAIEIERVLSSCDDIVETAAIAVGQQQGPAILIIYVVSNKTIDKQVLRNILQQRINSQLNPLFKIHDIVFVPNLPKTASNKIMRRLLREQYLSKFNQA